MHGRLALPHAYGLHEYIVIARGLAQHDGLACLARHAAERSCRGGRTDKGVGMLRQLLHACLVAEYTALGALGAGVDGQHRQFTALLQHMQSEHVDAGGLAGTRHAGDADSARIAGIGQAFLYHLLRQRLMRLGAAFDQGHRAAQDADIALQYPLHIIVGRKLHLTGMRTAIGIHTRLRRYSAVHLQSLVVGIVFRMIHGIE